jgi:hypothetical protein
MNWNRIPWLLLLIIAIITVACETTPTPELTDTPSPPATATYTPIPLPPGEIPLRFEQTDVEAGNPIVTPDNSQKKISLVFLVDRSNSMYECVNGIGHVQKKTEFEHIVYDFITFSLSLFKDNVQRQELQIGYLYLSSGSDSEYNLTNLPSAQPQIQYLLEQPGNIFNPLKSDYHNNYRLSLMNLLSQANNDDEENIFVLITDGDFTDTTNTGVKENFSNFLKNNEDFVKQLHIFQLSCENSDDVWNQKENNYNLIENMPQAGQVLKQLIVNTSLKNLLPLNGNWWTENESKIDFGESLSGNTYNLSISVWAMGLKEIELLPSTLGVMSESGQGTFLGKDLTMPGPLGGSCELNKEYYYMTATSPPLLAYYVIQPNPVHKFLRLGTEYSPPTIKLKESSPLFSRQEVIWNYSIFDINLVGSFKVDGGDDGIDKFRNCYSAKFDINFLRDSSDEAIHLQTFNDVPFEIWKSASQLIGEFDPVQYEQDINAPGKLLFNLTLFDRNNNAMRYTATLPIKFYPVVIDTQHQMKPEGEVSSVEIPLRYSLSSYHPNDSQFKVYAVSETRCSEITWTPIIKNKSGEERYVFDVQPQGLVNYDSIIEYNGDTKSPKIFIKGIEKLITDCGSLNLVFEWNGASSYTPSPTSVCEILNLEQVTCNPSNIYIANGVYYGDEP